MANRLVDHLKARGRIASAGFAARWLQPLSARRWRQAMILLKTQPVGRITLALAAAFACGVVLGVGAAAVIGSQNPDGGTMIAAAAGQAGAGRAKPVERASYAVPVRVREEGGKSPPPVAEAPQPAPKPAPAPTEPQGAAASAGTPAATSAETAAATRAEEAPAAAAPQPTPQSASQSAPEPAAQPTPQPAPPSPVAAVPSAMPQSGEKAAPPPATEPLVQLPLQAATETQTRVQVPLADIVPTPAPKPALNPKPAAETAAVEPSTAPAPDPAATSAAPPAPAAGQQLALMPSALPDPEVHSPAEGAQTPDRPVVQASPSGEKKLQLASLPMLHGDATWIRNAVKLPDAPRTVAIAIIIDDMGIDQKRSKLAIGLPAPLTFSFIPYGYHLHALTAAAHAAGNEILVHVPMEPLDPEVDPGPNALRTTLSIAENRRRLDWDFSRFDGYVGLNNHMGSKFTAWKPGMEMVMKEVQARGLLFVDSFTSNQSVGFHLARADRLPSAARDIFIDHIISRPAIEHSLQELERIARRRGFAVGIAHPHDLSREILATWIPEAKARGISFVPISYIVRREMKSG
jgi:uncharacterized protein